VGTAQSFLTHDWPPTRLRHTPGPPSARGSAGNLSCAAGHTAASVPLFGFAPRGVECLSFYFNIRLCFVATSTHAPLGTMPRKMDQVSLPELFGDWLAVFLCSLRRSATVAVMH
jgi:hypothetical protein